MKPGSGSEYTLNIGPPTPAGVYDFCTLAVDSVGNATCETGNQSECKGVSFAVNIP